MQVTCSNQQATQGCGVSTRDGTRQPNHPLQTTISYESATHPHHAVCSLPTSISDHRLLSWPKNGSMANLPDLTNHDFHLMTAARLPAQRAV